MAPTSALYARHQKRKKRTRGRHKKNGTLWDFLRNLVLTAGTNIHSQQNVVKSGQKGGYSLWKCFQKILFFNNGVEKSSAPHLVWTRYGRRTSRWWNIVAARSFRKERLCNTRLGWHDLWLRPNKIFEQFLLIVALVCVNQGDQRNY